MRLQAGCQVLGRGCQGQDCAARHPRSSDPRVGESQDGGTKEF